MNLTFYIIKDKYTLPTSLSRNGNALNLQWFNKISFHLCKHKMLGQPTVSKVRLMSLAACYKLIQLKDH